MADPLSQIYRSLQRITSLIPEGVNRSEYLARLLDDQIAVSSVATPMGPVPIAALPASRVYASARAAVDLVDAPESLVRKPEGIVDLGVIEWLLRPAFLLKDGLIDSVLSGPWQMLARDVVRRQDSSVCRIDLSIPGYDPIHFGTGFVVGRTSDDRFVVMTAAHVVDEALQAGWQSVQQVQLVGDFGRYADSTVTNSSAFVDQYDFHPSYDLALLYLSLGDFSSSSLPDSLVVAAEAPSVIDGLQIGVVGHPSFHSNSDSFPRLFGFGPHFGVKRFSPGLVRTATNRFWRGHFVDVILHDATTLRGSSGSCVLDMHTMKIIGLHFGGWPMPKKEVSVHGASTLAELFYENGAVPLWLLHDDPLLSHVEFG